MLNWCHSYHILWLVLIDCWIVLTSLFNLYLTVIACLARTGSILWYTQHCLSTLPKISLCCTLALLTIPIFCVNWGHDVTCSCVQVNIWHTSHCKWFAFRKLFFTWIVLECSLNRRSHSHLLNLLSVKYADVESTVVAYNSD